ncbi:protein jim lovell isoform X2 [Contarinia nasturtii]|uniref:protein jim lovell isoform X2 n=1 Tax=Contarinia nasturtii TaxID=265458 RepID=UPI0012D3993D|nr:protein jim lovell isoform X2 [Contarinia nasturtii]
MTEQEHYSLRWNNHQHHILRAFDALLQTKSLVDVTLVCAETSICAHKVVLSACSPFFQNVFAENPCKHPVIVLKDFPGWVVQAVVDFMYRGEISVPQKRLETLIQVGESLQIRGLVEHRVAATKDLSGSLNESTDDYLEPQLSNDSIEPNNYDDDDATPTMVKSVSLSTNAQNGKKHPRLLNSNSFNDISAASIANTTITQTSPTLPINNNNNSNSNCSSNSISNNNNHQIHHQNQANENRDIACTSPMPRRKQARPRRRSGEGGPHDYSSKSTSPVAICAPDDDDDDNNPTETETNKERIENNSNSHSHINNITNTNTISSSSSCNVNEQRKQLVNKCIESMTGTNLDTDKVVDCTVAAIEQSIIRDKLNANDDDMTDNEMDDDDDEDNDATVHDMRVVDDIEPEDDLDEGDDEHDEKLSLEGRKLRKRTHQFFCEDDGDSSAPDDHDDDMDDADGPENLCIKNTRDSNTEGVSNNNNNKDNNSSSNSNSNNNNRIGLALKDIRHLNRPPSHCRQQLFPGFPVHHHNQKGEHLAAQSRQEQLHKHDQQRHSQLQQAAAAAVAAEKAFMESQSENMKREALESRLENESAYMDQMDLTLVAAAAAAAHHHHNAASMHHPNSRHHELENNLHKEFTPSSPMSLQSHFNPREGPPHPPSPLQFPVFGLDSPLSLFPPGMDPGKLYNPLMEMPDPRSMHPHPHGPYLKKKNKLSRPKGQHSAPRGGPPRSWTNAELTEALHHVWNKKMTTSQASRLFGIPYNSLLMYVRGKYGKSLNLEQLRKGCISGPPIELLTMGLGAHTNNNGAPSKSGLSSSRSSKELKDLDENQGGRASGSSSMKRSTPSEPDLLPNPNAMFNPFSPGFYPDFAAGFPGLPLSMLNLLPPERHPPSLHGMQIDEDCKSDRSKQSLEDDYPIPQPLALNRDDRRELIQQNGQD